MTTLSINRSALAEGFVPSKIAAAKPTPTPAHVNALGLITRVMQWVSAKRIQRASTRRLQVAETVALGEKRFVSVVNVGDRQFLIGGGPTNVSLIAELGPATTFEQALKLSAATMAPTEKAARNKRLPINNAADKFLTTSTFTTSINGPLSDGEAITNDVIASLTAPKPRKSAPRRTATHKVAPSVAAKLAPAPSSFTFSAALAPATPRRRKQTVVLSGETA